MKNKINNKKIISGVILALILTAGITLQTQIQVMASSSDYYSPYDVAYSPDGDYMAVTDLTKAQLVIINASTNAITRRVQLNGQPKALTWSDSNLVYATEYDGGNVAEINPSTGNILRRFPTGPKPSGVAVTGNTLVVTDFGLNKVSMVNLTTGLITGEVEVKDYPMFLDTAILGKYAVVAHATPMGDAFAQGHASSVSFVDLSLKEVVADVKLPTGSSNLRGIVCSPDQSWVYVAHTFGKTNLPTTQLDNGWVNTNAISILNAEDMSYYTTFLLDTMSEGAANPWGLAISSDSSTLWISISGTHQVYNVDLTELHELLEGNIPNYSGSSAVAMGGIYKIINRGSEKCITVPSGAVTNGTELIQYTDTGSETQQWLFSDSSDGYCYIQSVSSSKRLDNGNTDDNNSRMMLWDASGSVNQQWMVTEAGDGYFKITCRKNGKALDNTGSYSDNTGIIQYTDVGNQNQQWKLVQVGGSTSTSINLLYRSKAAYDKPYSDIWFKIKANPAQRDMLKYDLGALWGAGLLKKIKLPGQGPRGISLSPDGTKVATGAYFAGEIYVIRTANNNITNTISLGNQAAEDNIRRGERLFFDASTTMQQWLSCATCHPGMRADGLDWDMGNDGLGNTKNTKTLLNTFEYKPKTWRGVRPDAAASVSSGFKFIKYKIPEQYELDDISAYIQSVSPEVDPYRNADGSMTADAIAGEAIFYSNEAKCSYCHNGPYFTNMSIVDVGTVDEQDASLGYSSKYCTPTLTELWRTAPYLHDGSAATIEDVLVTKNAGDKHGKTSHLSSREIDQLAAYLLQIPIPGSTTPAPSPTPINTPSPVLQGDANGDGTISIIDALMTAQYYVGLNPPGFDAVAADANCDNTITIVDALLIAQYYVGLINGLDCD